MEAKERNLTFYKRKKGLLKKAMELSIIWDVHVMLLVFNHKSKKCSEFSTLPLQYLIDMYNKTPRENVQIFAPCIEKHINLNEPTIKALEWSDETRLELIESARIIRQRKEEGAKSKFTMPPSVNISEVNNSLASEIGKPNNKRQKLSEFDEGDREDSKLQIIDGENHDKNMEGDWSPYKLIGHMIDPNTVEELKWV